MLKWFARTARRRWSAVSWAQDGKFSRRRRGLWAAVIIDLVDSRSEHFIAISFKNAKIRIDREAIRTGIGWHFFPDLVL